MSDLQGVIATVLEEMEDLVVVSDSNIRSLCWCFVAFKSRALSTLFQLVTKPKIGVQAMFSKAFVQNSTVSNPLQVNAGVHSNNLKSQALTSVSPWPNPTCIRGIVPCPAFIMFQSPGLRRKIDVFSDRLPEFQIPGFLQRDAFVCTSSAPLVWTQYQALYEPQVSRFPKLSSVPIKPRVGTAFGSAPFRIKTAMRLTCV